MKLNLPKFHVRKEKAEKYLILLSRSLNIAINNKKDLNKTLRVSSNGQEVTINFPKELEHVMRNGTAKNLQFLHDNNDKFLNSALPMAVMGQVAGIKMKISSNYGDHSGSIRPPGAIEAPELSLAEDIVHFRKEAVKLFNKEDIFGFTRYYRAHLSSSISLIDCFLYRYNFHIKNMVKDTSVYENTQILDSRAPIEDRIIAWLNTFANHRIEELKKSKEWTKFKKLKQKRNDIIHPKHPTIQYQASDIVRNLNLAQDGIGGLIGKMRKFSGASENIGLIRRISTLPDITIEKKV